MSNKIYDFKGKFNNQEEYNILCRNGGLYS
jgi:hypothetical protein